MSKCNESQDHISNFLKPSIRSNNYCNENIKKSCRKHPAHSNKEIGILKVPISVMKDNDECSH